MAYKVVDLKNKNVYPNECFSTIKLANEFKSHAERITGKEVKIKKCSNKETKNLELVSK